MDRRDFFGYSAAAMAAGFSLSSSESLGAHADFGRQPAAGGAIDSPPVLQNPAPDAMTVSIAVRAISTAWVEYGTSSTLGQRADNSRHGLLPLDGRIHKIRLEGLKRGTRYWYRVGVCPIDFRGAYKITRGAAEYSETFSFTTPGRASTASFRVINDTHENETTLKGVTERLAACKPGPTFWNGDVFNDVRHDDQVVSQLFRPAGSAYAASSPLCLVSGNHDVRGIHARQLDRFMDHPGGVRFFTLRDGPIAYLVMDTGEDKPDGHRVYAGLNDFSRYRDAQRAWLERAIEDEEFRGAAVRVALMHIPLWGPGSSEDSRVKWAPLLARAGIHALICGHTHHHAVTPRNVDHPYVQVVGGGPAPESATVIEGHADNAGLALLVHDLAGKELANLTIPA